MVWGDGCPKVESVAWGSWRAAAVSTHGNAAQCGTSGSSSTASTSSTDSQTVQWGASLGGCDSALVFDEVTGVWCVQGGRRLNKQETAFVRSLQQQGQTVVFASRHQWR